MSQNMIKTDEYRNLIADLKNRVQAAQIKAAVTVNTQLIALYWDIGKQIAERQKASGWGDGVIEQIAKDLTHELGGLKGRKPIAQDRQEEVLRLAALGLTKASIAKKLSLGEATVYRILARESAQKQSKSQN